MHVYVQIHSDIRGRAKIKSYLLFITGFQDMSLTNQWPYKLNINSGKGIMGSKGTLKKITGYACESVTQTQSPVSLFQMSLFNNAVPGAVSFGILINYLTNHQESSPKATLLGKSLPKNKCLCERLLLCLQRYMCPGTQLSSSPCAIIKIKSKISQLPIYTVLQG